MTQATREDKPLKFNADLSGAQSSKWIDEHSFWSGADLLAAEALQRGELVVFPTETVYGLAAIANSDAAMRRIFEAKGRPSDNPLILHVAKAEDVFEYCEVEDDLAPILHALTRRFWPGPLTLILPAKPEVSRVATAGLDTLALRCPDHEMARRLIDLTGFALAAPSANRSGKPSATCARDAFEDLETSISYCIDGGACEAGLESTILDLSVQPARILRPGKITPEQLSACLSEFGWPFAEVKKGETSAPALAEGEQPKAPGMKYRHYAPEAPVRILPDLLVEQMCFVLENELTRLKREQETVHLLRESVNEPVNEPVGETLLGEHDVIRVGIYASDAFRRAWSTHLVRASYEAKDMQLDWITFADGREDQAAQGLFHALRELDRKKPKLIFVQDMKGDGIALAYRNRLQKAAAGGSIPQAIRSEAEKLN